MNPASHLVTRLREILRSLSGAPRLWVGFSGGADSTALLIALQECSLDIPSGILAAHFNHGLHVAAPQWQKHCEEFCATRHISFYTENLDLSGDDNHSPEERARHHRYSAVRRLLGAGELFLTAHHADDNAETLLLNLMRGSGIDGLCGIPRLRRLGKGWLARPLLDFRRSELEEFLRQREISWLEDPSNINAKFDRNFLRSNVIPNLESRWPEAVTSINQTARHARDMADTLTGLLAEQHGHLMQDSLTLPLSPLRRLRTGLQSVIIRQWLRDQGIQTPPRRRLLEFLRQLNETSNSGRSEELRWSDWMIKRHGDSLWLQSGPAPSPCPVGRWAEGATVDLGAEFGAVSLEGVSPVPAHWEIGPRRKNALMQLHESGRRRQVKELLRLSGVPPWLRDSVPLLYDGEQVIAMGDWLIAPPLRRLLESQGATYHWSPRHPLLCKLQSVSVEHLKQTDLSHGQISGTTA